MNRALPLLGLASLAGAALWRRRDKDQVEALWAVALKKPTLYRVTLNAQVPMVEIKGNGARIIGTMIHGARNGIDVRPA